MNVDLVKMKSYPEIRDFIQHFFSINFFFWSLLLLGICVTRMKCHCVRWTNERDFFYEWQRTKKRLMPGEIQNFRWIFKRYSSTLQLFKSLTFDTTSDDSFTHIQNVTETWRASYSPCSVIESNIQMEMKLQCFIFISLHRNYYSSANWAQQIVWECFFVSQSVLH